MDDVERLERLARDLRAAAEEALAKAREAIAGAGAQRLLRSTDPLERFNREIGRRTGVVGIFPDDRRGAE